MSRTVRVGLSALALVLVASVGAGALLWSTSFPGEPLRIDPVENPPATRDDLAKVAELRVFFGHRSVGKNILDAVPAAYTAAGLPVPAMVDLGEASALPGEGPMIADTRIGENGDPLGKLGNFDARLRAGLADQLDVAVLKFCYADITDDTDVPALFERYRVTLAALEGEYPEVTFLHMTSPVRTEPTDLKWRVKELIRRPNDNAARERYNALMRAEYGDDLLLDLALIEATAPDGSLTTVPHAGRQHLALAPANAKDPGHLNATGSLAVATRLLGLLGRPDPVS